MSAQPRPAPVPEPEVLPETPRVSVSQARAVIATSMGQLAATVYSIEDVLGRLDRTTLGGDALEALSIADTDYRRHAGGLYRAAGRALGALGVPLGEDGG